MTYFPLFRLRLRPGRVGLVVVVVGGGGGTVRTERERDRDFMVVLVVLVRAHLFGSHFFYK